MLQTFQIFGRTIAMYGLFIVIGFLFGVTLAVLRCKKYNIPKEDVVFSSCFAGIGLVIGAKLLYLMTILPQLIQYRQKLLSNPSLILPILSGGFVFYGGLIGAVLGIWIYCRTYRINILEMLDLMAPSIPLIHGYGRLGCLSAGCCYGEPYNGPFNVIFHISHYAPNNIGLFPTQSLESILNFIACILLLLYAKKTRRTGKVVGIYLFYYSIMRFIIEFYRGDVARGFFLGLSTSQWISIVLLPLAFWLYFGVKPLRLTKSDL